MAILQKQTLRSSFGLKATPTRRVCAPKSRATAVNVRADGQQIQVQHYK